MNIETKFRIKLVEHKGLRTNQLMAKEIGINANSLSEILNGKLTHVSKTTFIKLSLWIIYTPVLEGVKANG